MIKETGYENKALSACPKKMPLINDQKYDNEKMNQTGADVTRKNEQSVNFNNRDVEYRNKRA